MSLSNEERLYRSRFWKQADPFTRNDIASLLTCSASQANHLLTTVKEDLEKMGNGRYRRRLNTKLLRTTWVSTPSSSDYSPEWC